MQTRSMKSRAAAQASRAGSPVQGRRDSDIGADLAAAESGMRHESAGMDLVEDRRMNSTGAGAAMEIVASQQMPSDATSPPGVPMLQDAHRGCMQEDDRFEKKIDKGLERLDVVKELQQDIHMLEAAAKQVRKEEQEQEGISALLNQERIAILRRLYIEKKSERSADELPIIRSRWILFHKIGKGSYGCIITALDLYFHEEVAVKIECHKDKRPIFLRVETQVYEYFNRLRAAGSRSAAYIPRMHAYGTVQASEVSPAYDYLVMDHLGQSLWTHWTRLGKVFSEQCVLTIGIKVLDALEPLHRASVVHGDIKPANILTARRDLTHLLLVDFGMAQHIRTASEGHGRRHYPFKGTHLYAPKAAYEGLGQGPKDDLEALGYVLVQLLRGTLPWEKVNTANEKDYANKFYHIKKSTGVKDLCAGVGVLEAYFSKLEDVSGFNLPNYNEFRAVFRSALQGKPEKLDWVGICQSRS